MATLTSSVPKRYRVATAFLAVFLAAACGTTTTANSENTGAGSEAQASAPADVAPPTSEPTRAPVERVKKTLIPEEGQVDSVTPFVMSADGNLGAKCAEDEGYTTVALTIGGTTDVDKTKVTTKVRNRGVVIEADGKLYSVEALIVNGIAYTPINPAVAQSNHTQLSVWTKDWNIRKIESLAFCNGGSGLNAPVN